MLWFLYPVSSWADSRGVLAHKVLIVVKAERMVVQQDVVARVVVPEGLPRVGLSVSVGLGVHAGNQGLVAVGGAALGRRRRVNNG